MNALSLPQDAQQCTIIRRNNLLHIKGWAQDIHWVDTPLQDKEDREMKWMVNNIRNIRCSTEISHQLHSGQKVMAVRNFDCLEIHQCTILKN